MIAAKDVIIRRDDCFNVVLSCMRFFFKSRRPCTTYLFRSFSFMLTFLSVNTNWLVKMMTADPTFFCDTFMKQSRLDNPSCSDNIDNLSHFSSGIGPVRRVVFAKSILIMRS